MKKFVFIMLIPIFIFSIYFMYEYYQSVESLSYYGSTGQEVTNIQTRLSNWGYYGGAVDGIYGWRTTQAVRYFQSKNGLTVDGVAGAATLAALGINSGGSGNSNVNLLARLINGEARGEPYIGQVAVGAVVLNRVAHPAFPKTIAGVIYQPGAFTAVSDGQIYVPIDPKSTVVKAARDALAGWDPTEGCLYYWNPATATSKWIWSRPITTQIGSHLFAK